MWVFYRLSHQGSPKLPYDPTMPLLGIYPEKTIIEKDTCTSVFTATLFTIARTWKQSRCPSTNEWIKKLWYIYTVEYCCQWLSHVWLFVTPWTAEHQASLFITTSLSFLKFTSTEPVTPSIRYFAFGCATAVAPSVEKVIFLSLNFFCIFVKTLLGIFAWVNLWIFYGIPLMYMSTPPQISQAFKKLIYFWLADNCFTILFWFLPHNNASQS